MKETEFHAWLRETVPEAEGVLIGIGDDAALLDTAGRIAVATDILVEGVHYDPKEASPAAIGAKAVNRNFSDMAAMGLEPHWILVSAAIPGNTPEPYLRDLVLGMLEAAKPFGVGIVGGDTSRSSGGLVVNVTVIGKAGDLAPVTRAGAMPGDRILVTHDLGGAALGKHLRFTPRVAEGLFLNQGYRPSSMIDISDGLAIDLSRVLDASRVGAFVDAAKIPISRAARELSAATGKDPVDHALSDGEDFELLFTLSPETARRLMRDAGRFFEVTDIGEIKASMEERILFVDGASRVLGREGYDHRI
jgi:thiamine-monophosphate kinase